MWKNFLAITLLAASQTSLAAQSNSELHVIVKYKQPTLKTAAIQKQVLSLVSLPIKAIHPMAGSAYTVTFSVAQNDKSLASSDALNEVLSRLRSNPAVEYAVEDRVGYFKPNPEIKSSDNRNIEEFTTLSHDLQWDEFTPPGGVMLESAPGLLDGAWAYTTGLASSPVIVAVLDTGVARHESLINSLVKDESGQIWGWNFAGNNRNLTDETLSYHGTHVAGTIAAYGQIIKGVGENLKVLPVKIPDASGMFYESQVINGIYWSVGGDVPGVPHNPYPAQVLNMSFGVDEGPGKEIDYCDEALQEALFFARKQGAVLAVAAGNDNTWEHYNAPAVCNHAMRIASVGPEGLRAYYSNYGPSVMFAAPGGDTHYGKQGGILSTVKPGGGYQGTGFDFFQGTSMATPHAAGVAGLLYAVTEHQITPERVERILYATTHAFGSSSDSNKSCVGEKACGHGILDANQAVKAAMAHYDVIFSAPQYQELKMTECGKNQVALEERQYQSTQSEWKQLSRACQFEAQLPFPTIRQEKGGAIRAYYGDSVYELNQSPFKHCEVIGVDGVGCYY